MIRWDHHFRPSCSPLLLGLALVSCSPAADQTDQAAARAEANETIATAINLSGNLCAKVLLIGPTISAGEDEGSYQVNCQEYPDGDKAQSPKNTVVYMVNPDTLAVKLVGRA